MAVCHPSRNAHAHKGLGIIIPLKSQDGAESCEAGVVPSKTSPSQDLGAVQTWWGKDLRVGRWSQGAKVGGPAPEKSYSDKGRTSACILQRRLRTKADSGRAWEQKEGKATQRSSQCQRLPGAAPPFFQKICANRAESLHGPLYPGRL